GDSNAICDCCGFKVKQSQLRKRWDGAMVCSKDFEVRHPQDFMKGRPERNYVKDARPGADPHFVETNEITADKL
ncbi:MAG TPA: hypothetical protein VFK88_05310, partial [Gallionella sp.]|nr:hypothetical protein [Gallionella sp.]